MTDSAGFLESAYDTGTLADPAVSGEPVEVAGGVFVIPDRRVPLVPNVGIVVGRDAALVIDTGLGPRNGEYVLDCARRLAGSRSLYLAVTQLDPGHAFGAQAFLGNATIIYSHAQRRRLRDAAAFAAPFETLGENLRERLRGLRLVDGDVAFRRSLRLDLGGVVATLRHWGPAHTHDDQTIHVDDRVLFGGDLFETQMFPILPYFPPFDSGYNSHRWLNALDALIDSRPQIVVPGHGEVTTIETIADVREHLQLICSWTAHQRRHHATRDDAASEVAERARRSWPDWQGLRNVRYAVHALYDEASRHEAMKYDGGPSSVHHCGTHT